MSTSHSDPTRLGFPALSHKSCTNIDECAQSPGELNSGLIIWMISPSGVKTIIRPDPGRAMSRHCCRHGPDAVYGVRDFQIMVQSLGVGGWGWDLSQAPARRGRQCPQRGGSRENQFWSYHFDDSTLSSENDQLHRVRQR